MHLSKRLLTLANMIPFGMEVVDIGCDHALLDIYLTKKNTNKCIAVDISQNVLKHAKANIEAENLENRIKIVQSRGLENVDVNDKTIIVIAGMGTSTILEILNHPKTKFLSQLIIQTNNEWERLRYTLSKRGFYLTEEQVIEEKNKYYVLMKWKKGRIHYTQKQCFLGPLLMKKKENTKYFSYLLQKYQTIASKLPYHYVFQNYKNQKRIWWLKKEIKNLK